MLILLFILAIGFFCWLLFQLAVYAFPFFIAVTAGFAAYHHVVALPVSLLLALLAGAATLGAGQAAFSHLTSSALRTTVGLLFAMPAAWAGYAAAVSIAGLATTSHFWCGMAGILSALATGATALMRLAMYMPGSLDSPHPTQAAAARAPHFRRPIHRSWRMGTN